MNTAKPISVSSVSSVASSDAVFSDSFLGLVKDFISLTKPKVMSLLLISTVCPMVLAAGWEINFSLLCIVLIGGALVSGSASAFNCIWDRDIDAIMERTLKRPIVLGRLTPGVAFLFSVSIGLLGLLILGYLVNPYAAAIALFGHFFYVFVYTIWLKRSSTQNIVIGGAAGAVPPMVGWVAVTGSLDVNAALLFLVVFLWTPPHFWALALNKNADYTKAHIPMLPVIAGEAKTLVQMFWYSIALIPCSLLLVLFNEKLGWISFVVMATLGIIFSWKILKLMRSTNDSAEQRSKGAWGVFGFSLVYLALFFVCIVVDALIA